MSRKRLEIILFVIIAAEVAAAVALITWAIIFRGDAAKPAVQQKSSSSDSTAAQEPVIQLVLYAQGFTRPTAIASAPDAADKRLFVAEAQGTIRSITGGTTAADPLLDIRAKVLDKGEMGLLGLALHPDFKKNGYFFINYIDKQQNTIIARYQISEQTGRADPASEKVLLKLKQPYANHNGGMLAFGPDGYLYAGLGDGGSGGDPENRAQNKNELLGKILRLDVNRGNPYAIPDTNPLRGQQGVKAEIWALGLRNPWRFSFDRTNGDLYIADVGQNEYEEISFQKNSSKGGENYGWRCLEGTQPYNPAGCQSSNAYTAPVLEYDHSEKRCSVTGGYVYRGSKYPGMEGKYFYADLCGGQIYYAANEGGKWEATLAVSTRLQISTFGEDGSGELFLADMQAGSIYRLTDSANQ